MAPLKVIERQHPSTAVGVVIVSQSAEVARGTAAMVRELVGDTMPLACCGGGPGDSPVEPLGTDVAAILAAIEQAWSERGVAILCDLGSSEIHCTMAIELQPPERQGLLVICRAPIVEGALVAAGEAAGGATLEQVRQAAEELSPP